MKLIVMGAGYVGMELLKQLKESSHEIFITTTHKHNIEALSTYGKVLLLEYENVENLNALIDKCDGMIILVAPKDRQNYEEVYLRTARVVASALELRQKSFFLLYTSSTSVCEGLKHEWITEDLPLNPTSDNGKILLETEKVYLNCPVSVCILRLGGIFGPGRELLHRAKYFSGKEMSTTGNEVTNHIHINDIVNGILFCLENRVTGIYHLVNDDHPTRRNLYSALCELSGLPLPLWNSDFKSLTRGYKIANKKIKDLGFKINYLIDNDIRNRL